MVWLFAILEIVNDDYDGDDDGTPTQQEWIRGTYDFDLHDTTTIHINMDWPYESSIVRSWA